MAVLLLRSEYGCEEGAVFLYNKLGRHDALLQHYMESGQHELVLRTCRQLGEQLMSIKETGVRLHDRSSHPKFSRPVAADPAVEPAGAN